MKQLAKILISTTLLAFACAGSALAQEAQAPEVQADEIDKTDHGVGHRMTIDPNGYTGAWTLDYGEPRKGIAEVTLGKIDPVTFAHTISLGGAELLFDVTEDGSIVPRNRDAADVRGATLRLKPATIVVDPAEFTGEWRIVEGGTGEMKGKRRVTLVRGLDFYAMEVAAIGGFHFAIDGRGMVTVQNELAATGGLQTLTLKNTERFRR